MAFFSPFSCYLAGNRSKKEDLVNLVTYSLVVAKGYCWREMGVSGNDYVLWYAVMIETEPNPAMWNDISGALKMSNKSEFSWNWIIGRPHPSLKRERKFSLSVINRSPKTSRKERRKARAVRQIKNVPWKSVNHVQSCCLVHYFFEVSIVAAIVFAKVPWWNV